MCVTIASSLALGPLASSCQGEQKPDESIDSLEHEEGADTKKPDAKNKAKKGKKAKKTKKK